MSEVTYQRTYELVSMMPAPAGVVAVFEAPRKGQDRRREPVVALGLARVQEVEHVAGRPERWRRGQNESVALVLASGQLEIAHTLRGFVGLEHRA